MLHKKLIIEKFYENCILLDLRLLSVETYGLACTELVEYLRATNRPLTPDEPFYLESWYPCR